MYSQAQEEEGDQKMGNGTGAYAQGVRISKPTTPTKDLNPFDNLEGEPSYPRS
jgi:hypothetical protein